MQNSNLKHHTEKNEVNFENFFPIMYKNSS